jgi:DNA repair photolyase
MKKVQVKGKGDGVGGPEWDGIQEAGFTEGKAKKVMRASGERITFSSGPMKMFGTLFNHPFPLELSLIKYCFQGCPFCFATANKRANDDVLGSPDDPTDMVIKRIQKANSPGYDSRNLIELCLHNKWGMVFSNNVDPFLPLSESKYHLGERILRTCLEYQQPLFIQTKEVFPNDTVRDLLIEGKHLFNMAVSISTINDDMARKYECGKVLPSTRLKRIEELTKAGMAVTSAINPYVPEWQPDLNAYFQAAKDAGCRGVYADALHFTPKQKKVVAKEMGVFANKCNQWSAFFDDCKMMKAVAAKHDLKLYYQAKLPDDFYGGNGLGIATWPFDAHWFVEFMYALWEDQPGKYQITWTDVDKFYADKAGDLWNAVVRMSEFAGVLWYTNDMLKLVRDTLGKENSIRNIVRFLYNNPDLYENFIIYYPEVKMLMTSTSEAPAEDDSDLTMVWDENDDLVYCFDASLEHRFVRAIDQDGFDFIGIDWE